MHFLEFSGRLKKKMHIKYLAHVSQISFLFFSHLAVFCPLVPS